jgi:uncharacterized membrane protein YdbT with pleckstrin-like domain
MSQVIIDRFRPSTLGWLKGSFAGWGTALLCLVLVGFVIILVRWIGNQAITFEVTEDRLVIHRGILNKSIDEIELYRIKDVRIDFSLINQWADIGTLTITSSDETTRNGPLLIRDVEHARGRREKLRELVNAARIKRGVRELDLAPEQLG